MDLLYAVGCFVLVLFVVVFGLMLPRWWAAWRALREQERRLSFVCEKCGYARTGLPDGGKICPECGTVLMSIDPRYRVEKRDRPPNRPDPDARGDRTS